MRKSFISIGIAELLMRWTHQNKYKVEKGESVLKQFIQLYHIVYIVYTIICTFMQCSPEGLCTKGNTMCSWL
jgi:hypothetical protein